MVAVREIGRLQGANAPANGPPCGAVDHAMGDRAASRRPGRFEEPDQKLDRRCFIVRDASGHELAYVYLKARQAAMRQRLIGHPPY